MKIYAKVRETGMYHSKNISDAVYGFHEMGFEVIKYQLIGEIYDTVTRDDIVLDYISQVRTIFHKFGVSPNLEDYPEVLKPFLGRRIWRDTINSINTSPEKWGIFVKPLEEKAFTGKIINGTRDLIGCGNSIRDYEVYCSEVVNIKREWRGFILYDKLIDLRPYSGDWHYNYDATVIDRVLDTFRTWKDRPMACSLDFAVVKKVLGYETIFLEANDAYALGNYGLIPLEYAKMISARWSQLLDRKDECKF